MLNQHLGRRVEPLAGERRPPRPSQAPSHLGSQRRGPDAGNLKLLEFALSKETARTAPLLPSEEGREENPMFHLISVKMNRYPLSQRKSNFLFLRVLRSIPPGSPADLESIRASSGGPVCFTQVLPLPAVFFPDQEPPRHGRTGTQLASGFTQVYISPSEPTRTNTVQAQGGREAGPAGFPN